MDKYDIAIIGGGPAGSTLGSLLKKYRPGLRVIILEKCRFPREHVGESQLPQVSAVLDEMGCWDKVEAAHFPIKIGATYRWGNDTQLWDFEFIRFDQFQEEPRPAQYQGQRLMTAFQVDRSVYDQILLEHAQTLGCIVKEDAPVKDVLSGGPSVQGLILGNGEKIEADYYIDASGSAAILRKKMQVPITIPTALQNIALWDYWENADWAIEIGVGGTRVQILSLDYGWIWFIPLSPTKTSIGLITPAGYYKDCQMSKEALYEKALRDDKRISELIQNATREHQVRATNDWSFLAEQLYGDNWFLCGECCGFADPILAAGLTISQVGAKELAYTLIALLEKTEDPDWLKSQYESLQKKRIQQHIRFANFWYTANGQFKDLQNYTAQIAADEGFELSGKEAFQWLGTGGFLEDNLGGISIGTIGLTAFRDIAERMQLDIDEWRLNQTNVHRINLSGATVDEKAFYQNGRVLRRLCYRRGNKSIAEVDFIGILMNLLKNERHINDLIQSVMRHIELNQLPFSPEVALRECSEALEYLIREGWTHSRLDPNLPQPKFRSAGESGAIHYNQD